MNDSQPTPEIVVSPATARRSLWSRMLPLLCVVVFLGVLTVLWTRYGSLPPSPAPFVPFEIRLAETAPGPGLTKARVPSNPTQVVYLHTEPLLTNADLESATAIEVPGGSALQFSANQVAAARLWHATATHTGKPLAILLNGEVHSAPIVNSQIGGHGVVMGDFTPVEAERIARGIVPQR